jgi:Ala-tRNA(Pro) deacylase
MSTETDLVRELDRARVAYELLPHDPTDSALAEARALGVPPTDVAKTLVLETDDAFVRAVLPASERIDLQKVRDALAVRHVELASEATLAGAYPDFELGAVPPLGGPSHDTVVFDRRLTEREHVVFEAGRHDESVRVSPADLVAVTGATVADICVDAER